jgi:hypothetical protein
MNILPENSKTVYEAWPIRAPELAAHAMTVLVNRIDVHGGYRPMHLREPGPIGNIWTKPAIKDRGKKFLTEEIMTRHFAGRDVGDLIGLHSTSAENTSRWGAIDVDWHGESSVDPQLNWEAAKHWFGKLRGLGFHPLLEDSNGCGGHHLWALFREPVPTARVFWFLRWLIRDFADLGLPSPPEAFPKQERIEPGKFGNWLRVFGRHHTKPHWSTFWDGQQWLTGARAIDYVLATQGDPATLIPAEAMPVEKPPRYDRPRYRAPVDGDRLSRRIRPTWPDYPAAWM